MTDDLSPIEREREILRQAGVTEPEIESYERLSHDDKVRYLEAMVRQVRDQLGQEITMSGSQSPLEYLKQSRQLLVEERRSVIFNFFELRTANRQDNTPTSLVHGRGAEVQKLQEEIEAVDRAIKDEEALSE